MATCERQRLRVVLRKQFANKIDKGAKDGERITGFGPAGCALPFCLWSCEDIVVVPKKYSGAIDVDIQFDGETEACIAAIADTM